MLALIALALPNIGIAKHSARQYLRQPASWYASDEAKRIAANILSYQSDLGGWSKNIDMGEPMSPLKTGDPKVTQALPTCCSPHKTLLW